MDQMQGWRQSAQQQEIWAEEIMHCQGTIMSWRVSMQCTALKSANGCCPCATGGCK